MMRRIRTNIETLILRLVHCGFVFGYDRHLQENLPGALNSAHARETYREMRDWIQEQPLVFWPAKQREEAISLTEQFFEQDSSFADFYGYEALEQEKKQIPQETYIEILAHIVGRVPPAVQAWFEEIAEVNFSGYHPKWAKLVSSNTSEFLSKQRSFLMTRCDPFQIVTPNEQETSRLKEAFLANKACNFVFAPDRYFKDYTGGSSTPYAFVLPQARMDAMIHNPFGAGFITFVEYIRLSLAWGGFPGMSQWLEVPRDDLEFLTHDLLPF